jgi:Spy/CpxP family protein refolding chaperone
MFRLYKNFEQPVLRSKVSVVGASLTLLFSVVALMPVDTAAQGVRQRKPAPQKKAGKNLERANTNSPRTADDGDGFESDQIEAGTTNEAITQTEKNRLDGIRQRGIRSFFTNEEVSLVIPGFGRSPVVLMIMFRQLDLTPEQKVRIRGIRQRVGRRLALTRNEIAGLESQLESALYGTGDLDSLENFDPKLVEELTDSLVRKQAVMMKLQTSIESEFRQILTPDQFFVFRELLREIVLPGRRPGALQQQRRMGGPQPPPGRPNIQDLRENN